MDHILIIESPFGCDVIRLFKNLFLQVLGEICVIPFLDMSHTLNYLFKILIIIIYIKTLSRHLKMLFWWLFLHHLGMREGEREITFSYFRSLTADRHSIDARKKRFLFFFKSSDRGGGIREIKSRPRKEATGFLKVQFFLN